MRTISLILSGLFLLAPLPGAADEHRPIVVFAGSASQPPLEAAAQAFQARTGIPVVLHFGGSGALLNQIRLTGQGDLYIPGSHDFMEKARALGLVEDESVKIAYLVPAIIVARGNPLGITGLHDLGRRGLRVGMAEPRSVCIGLYAVEILEANLVARQVRPNLTGIVESCAKAAAMIPLNLADVVLGWREFAAWHPDSMEAVPLAPGEAPRLAYIPAAALRSAKNRPGAMAFITYLKSAEGQAIFKQWGYITEEKAAREMAPQARIGGSYLLPEGW
jgi:molybdate transport system substrate-binding protein